MILLAKSIRDMPAVLSAVLSAFCACCVAWRDGLWCGVSAAVSSVEIKWVSGCVVLEAVRVMHVFICKCVVQRRVAFGTKTYMCVCVCSSH